MPYKEFKETINALNDTKWFRYTTTFADKCHDIHNSFLQNSPDYRNSNYPIDLLKIICKIRGETRWNWIQQIENIIDESEKESPSREKNNLKGLVLELKNKREKDKNYWQQKYEERKKAQGESAVKAS